MNQNHIPDELTLEEREIVARLSGTAESLQPNSAFVKKTETELRNEFFAKRENRMKRMNFIWQSLAGAAAFAALTLFIVWLVRSVAPEINNTPVPAINLTLQATPLPVEGTPLPTATPALPAYERFGTIVYRVADFPAAPTEADLYVYTPSEQSATIESARALAQRLGIDGQVYSGGYYAYRYLVSDGQQRLFVNSDQDFLYFSTTRNMNTLADVPLDVAQPAIESYLEKHGFTFDYKIQAGGASGWFMVIPVTANGQAIFYGSIQTQGLSVAISPDGQILQMQANLLSKEGQTLGKFALLSAEEAWQKFLDPTTSLGTIENTGSGQTLNAQSWNRTYPENQPMTLYCGTTVYPAIEPGLPPLVTCDDFVLSGNLAELDKLDSSSGNTFIAAQGQFKTDAGIRTFQVESWEVANIQKQYLTGGEVRREGDQVIFTVSGTDYSLFDVPADFPVPAQDVGAAGVPVDNVFEWNVLGIHMPFGGGGGGGGAFAKINLSGTPVPWPTPEPIISPTPSTVLGQRLDGVRGDLRVLVYQKADGGQVKEYQFSVKTDDYYTTYILQGTDLAQLDDNNNRPVDIWGVVTGYTPMENPILTVERSVIPYPDLNFQVLRGKQKISTIDGQDVILLTTEDGKTYVEFSGDTPTPSFGLIGAEGDPVDVIILAIPDEIFGGYQVARVFGGGPASDTANGQQPEDMPGWPGKPFVIPGDRSSTSALPALTIESIELGYYITDPRNSSSTGAYLQPVWRFYGHYSDGSIFECLVQALKPEYLYPEEEQTGN